MSLTQEQKHVRLSMTQHSGAVSKKMLEGGVPMLEHKRQSQLAFVPEASAFQEVMKVSPAASAGPAHRETRIKYNPNAIVKAYTAICTGSGFHVVVTWMMT